MSIQNQNHEDFRVKTERYEIVVDGSKAATWERIAEEHNLHAGPRRTVSATESTFAPNDADVTTAALYEANVLLIQDAPTDDQRYKAWLRSMPGSEEFVTEHLDSICATTLRKHRMRDADSAKLEEQYADIVRSDTVTEIGRQQLYAIEDKLNALRDQVDMWMRKHRIATEVYAAVTGKMWQDRDRINDRERLVTDIAARWERMIEHSRLMATTKIFVTGGNDMAEQAEAQVATISAKVGKDLTILVCDNDSGFNAAVVAACRKLGVNYIPVRYRDPRAKNREPQRIRDVFAMAPNGVVVCGGGGIQLEAIKLADAAGVKKRVVKQPVLAGVVRA